MEKKSFIQDMFTKSNGLWDSVLISVISVIMSFFVGAIIMLILGYNPILAYTSLIKGAAGDWISVTMSIRKAIPLIFSGLAVAIGFKCSAFNFGVEGQFAFGALCAGLVGVYVKLPPVIHVVVCFMAGILGGMFFAFLVASLKLKFNVDIVISAIMFNYVSKSLCQFLVMGPFHGASASPATDTIQSTAQLPALLPKPYQLDAGFIIMLLSVLVIGILMNKTTTGFEMTSVGYNSLTSKMQGINAEQKMFLALLIGGALAGIGGSIEICGNMKRVVNNFSAGYGFAGIPVALMAKCNPYAVIVTGLFFGFIRSGSFLMQSKAGVSSDMVSVIQGLTVMFICLENLLRYWKDHRRKH